MRFTEYTAGMAFGDFRGWIKVGLWLDYACPEHLLLCMHVMQPMLVLPIDLHQNTARARVGLGLD